MFGGFIGVATYTLDVLINHGCWQLRDAAIAGAVGTLAGMAGYLASWFLPLSTTLWGTIASGTLAGMVSGVAGQLAYNIFTGQNPLSNLGRAALGGMISGGASGAIGYGARQLLYPSEINPPTYRPGLSDRMGTPPSNMMNPQAHHDLPWKFKDWFAGPNRGLDVNDPMFGRWVEGSPVGSHQIWSSRYNAAWGLFKQNNPNANRLQVIIKLLLLRLGGKYPSR